MIKLYCNNLIGYFVDLDGKDAGIFFSNKIILRAFFNFNTCLKYLQFFLKGQKT